MIIFTEVEFDDGHIQAMAANQIADNLFAQIDENGNRFVMIDEIVDHRRNDSAVSIDDAFFVTSQGTRQRRRTTKGWELLVQCKEGSSNWIALKDLKEAYPVEIAEYSIGNRIQNEP